MVRLMIQLTKEQKQALEELAKARKTSVAKLVRESVAEYVATATRGASREEKRKRALEFIRKIEKGEIQAHDIEGKTDVAENHDKYLAEIYGSWDKSS